MRRWLALVLGTFGVTAAIAVPLLAGSGKSHARTVFVTVLRTHPYQVVVQGAPRSINAGALMGMRLGGLVSPPHKSH